MGMGEGAECLALVVCSIWQPWFLPFGAMLKNRFPRDSVNFLKIVFYLGLNEGESFDCHIARAATGTGTGV